MLVLREKGWKENVYRRHKSKRVTVLVISEDEGPEYVEENHILKNIKVFQCQIIEKMVAFAPKIYQIHGKNVVKITLDLAPITPDNFCKYKKSI